MNPRKGSDSHTGVLGHDHRRARRPASDQPLVRSRRRLVGGVAGGVAEFVKVDARLVRWIWGVSLPLSGGLSGIAYLLLWALLPGPERA